MQDLYCMQHGFQNLSVADVQLIGRSSLYFKVSWDPSQMEDGESRARDVDFGAGGKE